MAVFISNDGCTRFFSGEMLMRDGKRCNIIAWSHTGRASLPNHSDDLMSRSGR